MFWDQLNEDANHNTCRPGEYEAYVKCIRDKNDMLCRDVRIKTSSHPYAEAAQAAPQDDGQRRIHDTSIITAVGLDEAPYGLDAAKLGAGGVSVLKTMEGEATLSNQNLQDSHSLMATNSARVKGETFSLRYC